MALGSIIGNGHVIDMFVFITVIYKTGADHYLLA